MSVFLEKHTKQASAEADQVADEFFHLWEAKIYRMRGTSD